MSAAFNLQLPNFDWDFFITLAAWLASRTSIKADDEFVDFLKVAKEEAEIAGWLQSRAADEDAGILRVVTAPEGAIVGEEPPMALVEAVERRGIFKGAKDRAERVAKIKQAVSWALDLYKLYKSFAG